MEAAELSKDMPAGSVIEGTLSKYFFDYKYFFKSLNELKTLSKDLSEHPERDSKFGQMQ